MLHAPLLNKVMAVQVMWSAICFSLLHFIYVIHADITSVTYRRQCAASPTGGQVLISPSAIWCAQACSTLPYTECYAYIYHTHSRLCRLLPSAGISDCSSTDPQTTIMVSLFTYYIILTHYFMQ